MTTPHAIEILDSVETALGFLCLRRRRLVSRPDVTVTEVTLDHEFLMSSYNTLSERALAERAVALHGGSELRVLVGGLGLGYTAHAALESSRVARVEVVEYLRPVISWLERDLVPLAESLREDARFSVREGDIYALLREPAAATHDVILIDVDHSPEEVLRLDNATFYTVEGLELAREHLAPGGVLGVWSSAPSPTFAGALETVFPEVRVDSVTWRNDLIDEDQTDALFLARGEREVRASRDTPSPPSARR